MNEGLGVIILAAGKGKRMKGAVPKVMETLNGTPLIRYVADTVSQLNPVETVAVIGHMREMVQEYLSGDGIEFAVQEQQLGTGHAVMKAAELFTGFTGNILVIAGDVPVLTASTLRNLQGLHEAEDAYATILSAELDDPAGYGRILRDGNGNVTGIIEHKDASETQRLVREINSSIYLFRAKELFSNLDKISNDNAQGEYYLTDIIHLLQEQGLKISAYAAPEPDEIRGINTPEQLEYLETLLKNNPNWFDRS